MKTAIKSKLIDRPYLDVYIASNGVLVRAGNFGDARHTTAETAVFRDPDEFGKWCAEWMASHFKNPPPARPT